jgi:hypothetical protein
MRDTIWKISKVKRAGNVTPVVEHLPSKCETLRLNPNSTKKKEILMIQGFNIKLLFSHKINFLTNAETNCYQFILVKVFRVGKGFISWMNAIAESCSSYIFSIFKRLQTVLKCLEYFMSWLATSDPIFFESLPTCCHCFCFYFSHSDRYAMLFHCGFHFHFTNGYNVEHLCVLISEMCLRDFCPFYKWIIF